MKKAVLVFVLFLCLYTVRAQVLIIGQNKLNNTNLDNTTIVVKDKESGVITYSFNTRKKSEFELDLDFGRVYHVFLQNPKCPVMYFEVIANTVPKDKYDYTMSFALELDFGPWLFLSYLDCARSTNFCKKTSGFVSSSVKALFLRVFCLPPSRTKHRRRTKRSRTYMAPLSTFPTSPCTI